MEEDPDKSDSEVSTNKLLVTNLEIIENNPDPVAPQECCRCSAPIADDHQVFDCDSCVHAVCVLCRFKEELSCNLCGKTNRNKDSIPKDTDYVLIKKEMKKKFNIDHIVDVEVTTTDGVFVKQMCTVCKRVFKKSNARYHYHCASDKKPFSCTECGQTFIKKSHMESHLNNHFGIKPFKCNFKKCKASFTQKDKLTRHLKSHNKTDKFTCSICQKNYTTQAILSFHIKQVHNSNTKMFQCDSCPRSYKYKQSLFVHRLKHQAVREFMCEVCGKKYPLIAQLKLHKRSHVVYHRRPYKCHCGRRFISRRDRARHRLIHTTSRDFECSLCNTTFGRKDNLERHMKNFHQQNPPMFVKGKPMAAVSPFNKRPNNLCKENKAKKMDTTSTIALTKLSLEKKHPKSNKNLSQLNKHSVNVPLNESISLNPNVDDLTNKCISENVNKEECSKPPSLMPTVIVSPKTNANQNRESVIKNVPKLLPYRILPPDKRFLKMSEDLTKGKSPSELMPPPAGNCSRPKNMSGSNQLFSPGINNCDTQKTNLLPSIRNEKPISKEKITQRRRIPKDDALNRCYRIICHTSSMKPNITPLPKTIPEYNKEFVIINPNEHINKTSVRSVLASERIVNTSIEQIGISTFSSCSTFQSPNDTMDPGCNKPIGGPTLPSTVSDNTCDDGMHEDNFPNTYTNLTDVPSCTSYTPYFDSECFKENEHSYYEGNVDNLLPNDLDIGFQYVNEQLDCTEINFTSDPRNVSKYVSQESKTNTDSFS